LFGFLPFIEQQTVWEKISNPYQNDGVEFAAIGPVVEPWFTNTLRLRVAFETIMSGDCDIR